MKKGLIDTTTLMIVGGLLLLLGLVIGGLYYYKPELFQNAISSIQNIISNIKI
ncbi:hypothetical protein IPA_01050 [Ignicoccus pacificus DSM 13166]|uniref:Uncharacterized protein n=1 Tax=Ignicoccus pacificus DSM 13166 TaxID=940294 RepID=A0A977PKJ1_9CREN|nr:hypothetical protein IPA_01050 [Ignicoccus pacificus DSM 13166]